MNENLADTLLATANVLHWLGKYREANALILCSRLLRARGIETLEALASHVTEEEDKK